MDLESEFWAATRVIRQALDSLDHSVIARMSDSDKVRAMTCLRTLAGRMSASAAVATSAVATSCATERTAGTTLGDFLAATEGRSTAQGQGEVFRATRMNASPKVRDAALAGQVSPDHAAAIGEQLRTLPRARMSDSQFDNATDLFLEAAATTAPGQLSRRTPAILERTAPEIAPSPADKAAQVAARRRRAQQSRRFRWGNDGDGSIWFNGQVPELEGMRIIPALQAFAEKGRRDEHDEAESLRAERNQGTITTGQYLAARRELESREKRSTGQRMADALVDMVDQLASVDRIPSSGGQPPRLVITIDHQQLHDALAGRIAAGHVSTGCGDAEIPVDAGSLRRLCCDAEILPVVLGGDSQVMDVGRAQRLVTPGIRRALEVRDTGCVFPGCRVPARLCQAHHVRPWWAGGQTALDNLVLVCRHHHGVVEPDRYLARDQWRIVFDPGTGIPRVIPPVRLRNHLPDNQTGDTVDQTGDTVDRTGTSELRENSAPTDTPRSRHGDTSRTGKNSAQNTGPTDAPRSRYVDASRTEKNSALPQEALV